MPPSKETIPTRAVVIFDTVADTLASGGDNKRAVKYIETELWDILR